MDVKKAFDTVVREVGLAAARGLGVPEESFAAYTHGESGGNLWRHWSPHMI